MVEDAHESGQLLLRECEELYPRSDWDVNQENGRENFDGISFRKARRSWAAS